MDEAEVRERKSAADRRYYEKNAERLREQSKTRYRENPGEHKKRVGVRSKQIRKDRRLEAIVSLGGKCVDCGNDNQIVLQFHHRPGEIKVGEVTALATSEKKFWIEVAKCDLTCANCHLIRHSEHS